MKCFVVLSCLVAVACGLSAYQGGYSGHNYAAKSARSESAEYSESSAAGAISSGAVGAAGVVGGIGAYGDAAYSSAAQKSYQSARSASSYARSSQYAAENAAVAGGYAGSYGGVAGGLADDVAIASGAAGYGGYASGYKAAAHEAVKESASAYASDVAASQGLIDNGVVGGYGVGGVSSVGQAAYNRQAASSYSRSYSSSSSSSSSSAVVNYQSVWPKLYQVPLFQSLCKFKSTLKSEEIISSISQTRGYDYASVFDDLYSRNALLQKYFYVATGVRYAENQRRTFLGLINQQPTYALKVATLFAKNPNVFTSPFGQFIIGGTSLELLSGYQSAVSRYNYSAFARSTFLNALVRSKYYSRYLCNAFGLGGFDRDALITRITSAYRSNAFGTLLLLRHVLARRQLYDYNTYLGCSSLDLYRQQIGSVWGRKTWRRNTYYSTWSRQYSRSSSYSASSSSSASSAYRAASAAGGVAYV